MLGILGGMGPLATVDFMAKIVKATPAQRDQDHIEIVTASAAHIPDRTLAIIGQGPDPLPAMLTALRQLERAGAERIAIPCNTAHHWHGALQQRTALPILHIVDAVLARIRDGGGAVPRQLGLLATDGTLRANVYPARLSAHGITCTMPDAEGQQQVMQAIRLIKAGDIAGGGAILRAQAAALIAQGASHVVMGCTEIPLALAEETGDLAARLIDPTLALAEACIAAERGQMAA